MSLNRLFFATSLFCAVLASATILCTDATARSSSLDADTDGDIDRMEQSGRYLDLRNYIELQLKEGVAPTATPLAYLCLTYGKLKQYTQLFDCLSKLQARIDAGDWEIQPMNTLRYNSAGDARPLLDAMRAEAFLEFGEYDKAIAAGEKALASIPKSSFSYSPPFKPVKLKLTVLPTLVISAVHAGDTVKAGLYLEQLKNVDMPFGGSGMWETLQSNGLGRAYMSLGLYKKAIDELGAYRRSTLTFGIADAARGWTAKGDSGAAIYELPRRLMLGKAYVELEKFREAKAALDDVLASPRAKDVGDIYWLTLFERGRIAEAESDLAAAARYYETAVQVIEAQRSTINTETNKIGFVGDKQAVYGRLIEVLLAQGRVADAFDYVERSKSRALVDMLAAKNDFASRSADPAKTKFMLSQLNQAGIASRAQDETAEPQNGTRALHLIRQEIESVAPELSSLVTVASVPSAQLKMLIGEKETLVEYYYWEKHLYAFVLDRENLRALKLNGDGLEEQVRALRVALENAHNNAWHEPAAALYARLWMPLEQTLGNAKNIVVVAHGVLHYLPFAALQRGDGRFLIDQYELRFMPSAAVLKYLNPARKTNKTGQMLVLGNPDLDNAKFDLPFAEREAYAVAALFPGSRILVRKNASETAFKKAGSAFDRIHFATHGEFKADAPLTSGLYLAQDADNDGALTVSELYTMNLDTDLVVLSACETGVGKISNGDDVVGLTRSLIYAGSRSIIASLWSVDDNATAELMQHFYGNLIRMNKEEALRQAQLSTRLTFAHPFYWAAFQLTGRSD